jgi:hypothetical protein
VTAILVGPEKIFTLILWTKNIPQLHDFRCVGVTDMASKRFRVGYS